MKNKLYLGIIALAVVLFLFNSTLTADESQSRDDAQIIATIENTLPNVVQFEVGSGFYISPTRILTNYHVIDSALWEGKVGFTNYQGEIIEATLLKYDKAQDFAILEVPFNAKVRTLQTAKVKVGQTVLVLGNPYHVSFTATKGMVSYLDRASGYKKSIQIDTNVTNGHSGSMVLSTDGYLVGVMVERLKATGLQNQWDVGFAIPIDIIKE